jgi:hypothetical protein
MIHEKEENLFTTPFRLTFIKYQGTPFCGTRMISAPGLPDFSRRMIPKAGKMYQMNSKYTKWS